MSEPLPVGIIGAGPAGATLARLLALGGTPAVLIDEREPHEKVCGGGVTLRGYRDHPILRAARNGCMQVNGAVLEGGGRRVAAPLPEPVRIYRRIDLNRILFRAAVEAGARFVKARVKGFAPRGRGFAIEISGSPPIEVGFIAGADGAAGVSRKLLGGGRGRRRFVLALGFHAERQAGDESLYINFPEGLAGYIWIFPRADHSSVGICSRDRRMSSRELEDVLHRSLAAAGREPPAIHGSDFTFPIPDFTAFEGPRSGPGWALIGDAGGFVDPITLEGIPYAMRSAELLASALRDGVPARFEELWRADFGKELARAAGLVDRFYGHGFTARIVRWLEAYPRLRELVGALMCGAEPYQGLRLRVARAILTDRAAAILRRLGGLV